MENYISDISEIDLNYDKVKTKYDQQKSLMGLIKELEKDYIKEVLINDITSDKEGQSKFLIEFSKKHELIMEILQ